VERPYDYLPDGVPLVDLADQIANSTFDDPVPRIWIAPVDSDRPAGQWNASCQFGDDAEEFYGSRDEAIIWARRTPAAQRFVRVDGEDLALPPEPGDAPPPPPPGPTVQVQGPNSDGRWVAVWFHRGQAKQFWGRHDDVIAWANAQPAERRRISVGGENWRPLRAAPS